MAQPNESVISIKYDQRIKSRKSLVEGKIVYDEEFSPFPGLVFQAGVLKFDDKQSCVILKNCGKETVQILHFNVKIGPNEVKKSNFALEPEEWMTAPCFPFQHSLNFQIHLDIDATSRGILLYS